jgi:hypothetical protein
MRRFFLLLLLVTALAFQPAPITTAQEAEAITILQRTPDRDTVDIQTNTPVTVVFSAPVVPLTGTADLAELPAPVRISPAVEGTGAWLNTIAWQFTPTEAFPPGATITVTTDDRFQSASGAPLTADQWQFTTQRARVSSIWVDSPERGHSVLYAGDPLYLNDIVVIDFNQRVQQEVIEALVRLENASGQAVPITLEWVDHAKLKLKPMDRFQISSRYTVVIESSLDGQQMLEEPFSQSLAILPYPSVKSVSPERSIDITANTWQRWASITFATQMDINSLEGLIRVEPEGVEWKPQSNRNDQISLSIDSAALQTYTITLLAGAKDIYGNTIDSDYTWSFRVVEPPPPLPHAYLLTRDSLNVTNAYRPNDTRMAMSVSGAEDFTSHFALYRARDLNTVAPASTPTNYVDSYRQRMAWEEALMPDSAPLREWEQTFNGGGERTLAEVLLAGEDGGQLDPGLYIVQADEYRINYQQHRIEETRSVLVSVSTAILTVRRTRTDILVWVTDMQTGAPLADVPVTRYSLDGTSETAMTNSDGLARLPTPLVPQHTCPHQDRYRHCDELMYAFITTEAPGVYGAWYSDRAAHKSVNVGYLYTDRRVYRPGDTVYFRGILRDKDDMDYSVPEGITEVKLRICPFWYTCHENESLQIVTVPVSNWGTMSGSFTLPADIEPEQYRIHVEVDTYSFITTECYQFNLYDDLYCYDYPSNGLYFTVAEFITPEFEVDAAPNAPDGIQGEPLGVTVNAQMYSGSPLRGGSISWSASAGPASFSYENYSFNDETIGLDYLDIRGPMSGDALLMTDSEGKAVIPTDEFVSKVTMTIRMGVTVTQGPETHSARLSFMLHPAAYYVGLRHETGRAALEQPTSVEVVTVTPDRQHVSGQTVAYTIEHMMQEERETELYGYYYWETVVTPIGSGEVTTGDDGLALIPFTPKRDGTYRVRAIITDEKGRSHSSTVQVRVGSTPLQVTRQPRDDDNPFSMTSDRGHYVPWDTARLTIQTPGSGMLLLTVQRQDVQRAFVLPIASGEPVLFDLPLGFEDAPNVYVSGTFVQGMPSPNESPFYATATLNLGVQPTHRELNVDVTASNPQAQPGDSVTFTVRVTDRQGQPVSAEVGLTLVDDAVLSLLPSSTPTLMKTFYSHQFNDVYSSISLRGLIDDLTDQLDQPGGGGGGEGGMPGLSARLDPRDDYQITPLWLPNAMTDENGLVTVSVVLPDNLTRWNLDVRVVSLNTSVGQTELDIISTLPFTVRPQTPRFLVVGDTVELAMSVHNDTDTAQTVAAVIQAEGVTLFSDAEQTVTLPPFSQQRVACRSR